MRNYIYATSRQNTDLISVKRELSSDDDDFILQIGDYFFKLMQENWIEAKHTDVGEKRSTMIENFAPRHRVRIRLEVRYRSRLPFIALKIDRPDNTPFGMKSMQLANGLKNHLYKAVAATIARNKDALSMCSFEYDGRIVRNNDGTGDAAYLAMEKELCN